MNPLCCYSTKASTDETYMNEQDTEIEISCNFHVSQYICFLPFKNVKTLLNSRAVQKPAGRQQDGVRQPVA